MKLQKVEVWQVHIRRFDPAGKDRDRREFRCASEGYQYRVAVSLGLRLPENRDGIED